jgi:hypothetical protein
VTAPPGGSVPLRVSEPPGASVPLGAAQPAGAGSPCGWVASCEAPARHRVERQTRPGLILRETVCDDHVDVARRRGYLLRRPVASGSPDLL